MGADSGEEIVLIGASGLAREVISALEPSARYRVAGLLDDDRSLTGSVIDGVEVLGPLDEAVLTGRRLVVCVGNGTARQRIVRRLAMQGLGEDAFATVIDATVRVPSSCSVGAGSIVLAGVVLTTAVRLGRHVVAMPQVTLTHDDVVEDFATLCAGVSLGGDVQVGEAAYLGMNCSIRQGVTVGAGCTVGMGAVVLADVPTGEVWVGNPARRLVQRESA